MEFVITNIRCIENMHIWVLPKTCFDMGANMSMNNGDSLMRENLRFGWESLVEAYVPVPWKQYRGNNTSI